MGAEKNVFTLPSMIIKLFMPWQTIIAFIINKAFPVEKAYKFHSGQMCSIFYGKP